MLVRENYLKQIRGFYDSDLVKILVGIRRCGKSVILEQIIYELKQKNVKDDHIINVNFEFIEYEDLKDYKKLNSYVKEKIIDDKMYYIFFDEIQNVDNFEVVVNSLRASLKNVSIFITGSNSKLLSEELSTVLSGRYVLFNIYPLSYKEYIKLTNKDAYDKKSFWDYAKWGGLPNRCEFNEEINIKNYLHGVFDSIILRDVVIRLGLKDTTLFNMILHYLIDTTGREFSADNILKYLEKEYKKVSTETLYTYLEALCKSLLIKKVYRYDIHGKAVLKTLNKYYVTDLGIAQIKNNSSNFEDYIILENIVYNELLYKGYEIYIGKTKTGEVDFIARKDNQTKYIQVTYEMKNETTREREFNAFNGINDSYPKYIISLDDKDYSKEGIINLNLIDFLMKEEF
ncbi:MAG: ATP-binding protein [Bacilli bacterium]